MLGKTEADRYRTATVSQVQYEGIPNGMNLGGTAGACKHSTCPRSNRTSAFFMQIKKGGRKNGRNENTLQNIFG